MDKLIITVAITGGVHGKAANPNLPEQPDEQVAAIIDSWNAGAAMAHIHVRDKDGVGVQDPVLYQVVKDGVRTAGCDIILNFTTGGSMGMSAAERLSSTQAGPEVGSLNMGTLQAGPMPDGSYYLMNNPPDEVEWFCSEMRKQGVKPEMEVYSPSMIKDVTQLIAKDVLEKPYWVNYVFGVVGQNTMDSTWENLAYCVSQLPPESNYTVCALGTGQLPITAMATVMGGHVRVGMEDNIYYAKGEPVKSNAQLVERSVKISREVQRGVASPAEARDIIGLPQLS